MSKPVTRRSFMATTAAAGLAAGAASGRAAAANERLRVAFLGVGNRGGQLLDRTLPNNDVDVVALCDVYRPFLEKQAAKVGGNVALYNDFRHVLDRDDIDAVFIATPDHWHALQTVAACESGKDVYIEKPLSLTILEGRKMIEAVRRTNRVATVGLHRRSSDTLRQLRELVAAGTVGKIIIAQAYRLSNMSPNGIGIAPDSDPPEGLDWDMWLGPQAARPYNENITPYKFRWWKSYSSQMGNWGVHYFDAIRWMLGEDAPASISTHGGRFAVEDARTIPDTALATFEFASGRLMLFGTYEANGAAQFRFPAEFELRGTQGTVYSKSTSFTVEPERGGQFQSRDPRMERIDVKTDEGDLTVKHIRNFLDCVKSREEPNAPIEEGHKSTVFCHLANIALEECARLEWDPNRERITNNRSANNLLHYKYRKPWKLA